MIDLRIEGCRRSVECATWFDAFSRLDAAFDALPSPLFWSVSSEIDTEGVVLAFDMSAQYFRAVCRDSESLITFLGIGDDDEEY